MTRKFLVFLGIVLAGIGIVGFFQDPVFGVFETDVAYNLFHILAGIIVVAGGLQPEESARTFTQGVGWAFAVLAVVGFLWSANRQYLWIFQYNLADSFLQAAIAMVSLLFGYGATRVESGREEEYGEMHGRV